MAAGSEGAQGAAAAEQLRRSTPTVRASLFITCLDDTLFPETGRAIVALLERLGVEVDFPLEQTCCGQMHFNTGYARETIPLVRRFVRVFADSELIVSPSASCVGDGPRRTIRAWPSWPGDAALRGEVDALAPRVLELSELLVDRLGVTTSAPTSPTASPTTRPATRCGCSSSATGRCGCCARCAGSTSSSCRTADECCGFGGTFAIKNADTSTAMLTDKVRAILDTGAEVCTAADSSCLMHIGGALSRQRSRGADDAPRRDPRRPTERDGADRARGLRAVPAGGARARSPTRSCATTSRHATHTIRDKRAARRRRAADWEELREAGRAIKERVLRHLDEYLLELEAAVAARRRHRALGARRGRGQPDRRPTSSRAHGVDEVVKAKSLTTDETELNDALAARGITRARDRPRAS